MNYIIEKYISTLTINNINDFAAKNNIFLTEKEQKIFYDIIKNHYKEILAGNDNEITDYLKDNLPAEKYFNIMKLYNEYKNKYKNYL